jgi:hypothetical protein
VGERGEQAFVQQLVAQAAVEALDEGVALRLAGRDVMPRDAGLDQRRIAVLISSVPLSETQAAGLPRSVMTASSSRPTRKPESRGIGH